MKINESKLTAFDMQIITAFVMEADAWVINDTGFAHSELGSFGRSMLGRQSVYTKNYASNRFRRLSWRGQIRMAQLHKERLNDAISTAVPELEGVDAKEPPLRTMQAGGGSLGGMTGGIAQAVSQMQGQVNQLRQQQLSATAMQQMHQARAANIQQAANELNLQNSQLLAKVQGMYMDKGAGDDTVDALKYLSAMQQGGIIK